MSFGWWTILDTHRKLLRMKNPVALQFSKQTIAPGTYYHIHPLNGTHTQSMSQLSQGLKIIVYIQRAQYIENNHNGHQHFLDQSFKLNKRYHIAMRSLLQPPSHHPPPTLLHRPSSSSSSHPQKHNTEYLVYD